MKVPYSNYYLWKLQNFQKSSWSLKTPDSKIEYNWLKKFKTRINSWNQIVPPLHSIPYSQPRLFYATSSSWHEKELFFYLRQTFFFGSKIEMPETPFPLGREKKIVNISVGLLSSSPKAIFCRKYLAGGCCWPFRKISPIPS